MLSKVVKHNSNVLFKTLNLQIVIFLLLLFLLYRKKNFKKNDSLFPCLKFFVTKKQ